MKEYSPISGKVKTHRDEEISLSPTAKLERADESEAAKDFGAGNVLYDPARLVDRRRKRQWNHAFGGSTNITFTAPSVYAEATFAISCAPSGLTGISTIFIGSATSPLNKAAAPFRMAS